ncbi:MAG TPA: hypothetical protein VJY43_01420, partial [Methanocorpusculum sp.]|nr:hypothetical protein [Methanocorpusculum sp.]
MLSDTDILADSNKLEKVVMWAKEFPEIKKIIFHISTTEAEKIEKLINPVALAKKTSVRISTPEHDTTYGTGTPEILIALG